MKSIQFAYAGLLVLLSLLWWIADPLLPGGYEYFAVRSVVINYTGVIGIGVMSLGMILALRPVRVEPLLGGLDKTGCTSGWGSLAWSSQLSTGSLHKAPNGQWAGAGWSSRHGGRDQRSPTRWRCILVSSAGWRNQLESGPSMRWRC